MNIYFAGSIKGSKLGVEIFPDIIRALENYGKVLTEHIGKVHQDQAANIAKTAEGIFSQDKVFLDKANIIVADITAPSLGVGREIAYCEHVAKIPVVCIYNKTLTEPSRMITGNPHNKIYAYKSIDDLKNNILPIIFKTS